MGGFDVMTIHAAFVRRRPEIMKCGAYFTEKKLIFVFDVMATRGIPKHWIFKRDL
jgi:hypothetical protein